MLLVVTLYRVPSTPSLFLQTETYRNNVLDSLRFLKTGSAVETLYLLLVQFSLCDGFEQSCVLIGFLGDMFIRLASKNENSTNENFEREDRFKEGTNSVDQEKRHLVEFGVSRRYFAVT